MNTTPQNLLGGSLAVVNFHTITHVLHHHALDKHGIAQPHTRIPRYSTKVAADLKSYGIIHHDGIVIFETDPSAASQESPSTGNTTSCVQFQFDFRNLPKVEREALTMHPSQKHPPPDQMLHTEGSIDWIGPDLCLWLPRPTLVSYMYRAVP